ncbi:MAG: hypothetical protein IPO58_24755 [Betaproteobacteria bacterium]|nr:hypothetical protein [Betaproteobacteria bacterium]
MKRLLRSRPSCRSGPRWLRKPGERTVGGDDEVRARPRHSSNAVISLATGSIMTPSDRLGVKQAQQFEAADGREAVAGNRNPTSLRA